MNLMQGLTRDIDGKFTIRSSIGTTVKIAFSYYRDIAKDYINDVKEKSQIV